MGPLEVPFVGQMDSDSVAVGAGDDCIASSGDFRGNLLRLPLGTAGNGHPQNCGNSVGLVVVVVVQQQRVAEAAGPLCGQFGALDLPGHLRQCPQCVPP
jgi:hypothetical protein